MRAGLLLQDIARPTRAIAQERIEDLRMFILTLSQQGYRGSLCAIAKSVKQKTMESTCVSKCVGVTRA